MFMRHMRTTEETRLEKMVPEFCASLLDVLFAKIVYSHFFWNLIFAIASLGLSYIASVIQVVENSTQDWNFMS